MNRPGPVWKRNEEEEKRRKKEYLYLAFHKCIARMEEEQIPSFAEYDEKYNIHYRCDEWLDELKELLAAGNDSERYAEVTERIDSFRR